VRTRRLYTGRPAARPLFGKGVLPAETPGEAEYRRVLEFRAALEGHRRDEVTVTEAREILARIGRMGIASPALATEGN
jgi:hypothetical protein